MSPGNDQHTDLTRDIRYRLTTAEDAIDGAVIAVTHATELSALDRHEFRSDIELIRDKLNVLRFMIRRALPR